MNADTFDGPTTLHQIDRDHIDAYRYSMLPLTPQQKPIDVPSDRDRRLLTAWADTVVDATELEHYASLAEMTRGSDAVVRGRVLDIEAGRVFGSDSGSALHYAALTIAVAETVAGSLPARHAAQLTLEVPLFGGPETLDGLRYSLPRGDSLFFLRNKGGQDADFYRLVVLRGVVVNRDGVAEVTPGNDVLDALAGSQFDEVVGQVRRSRP